MRISSSVTSHIECTDGTERFQLSTLLPLLGLIALQRLDGLHLAHRPPPCWQTARASAIFPKAAKCDNRRALHMIQQQPPLASLFNDSHVSAKSLRSYLLLVCYLPIGLTLLGIRLVRFLLLCRAYQYQVFAPRSPISHGSAPGVDHKVAEPDPRSLLWPSWCALR